MTTLITILFFGVAYGMILYLISVGLSVTMGLMGFVNLADGVFAMLGGYATVTLMNWVGVPFLLALAVGCVLVAALGFVLERTLYRHLYGRSELDQVLFSFGLILVAVALVRIAWGPLAQPIQLPSYLKGQVKILDLALPAYRLALVGFGAASSPDCGSPSIAHCSARASAPPSIIVRWRNRSGSTPVVCLPLLSV